MRGATNGPKICQILLFLLVFGIPFKDKKIDSTTQIITILADNRQCRTIVLTYSYKMLNNIIQ